MKIVEVRAIQPETPQSPQDWRTDLGQILVRIDTDEGMTGFGIGGGGRAGIWVINTVLRDLLLGQDPTDVEVLWAKMFRHTLPYGRKGLVVMAISGVDLALWDLRGKRADKPVVELLGGETKAVMPAYKTVWSVNDLAGARLEGFSSLKLHMGRMPVEEAIVQVEQAREIVGHQIQLMADAFMLWDIETALDAVKRVEPARLAWIEEPLPCDDMEGYARLRDESPVPIAGGEHEYTARAFEFLMQQRLHAVFQPDVCWCGGLTELVKIYALARHYGVRVCPHRGSEVWALHAIAALDPEPLAESGRPWMTFVHGQPGIVKGEVAVPHGPGFGVWFDEGLWA